MTIKFDKKGVTRLVIVFKKFVIKIPNFLVEHDHFLEGCRANWSERKQWKQWRNYKSDRTDRLCPTLFCSWFGLIQIQARADILPLNYHLTRQQEKDFSDITTDTKPSNFGYYKGRLVCVDYA